MQKFKTIIIGCGAGGSMCALFSQGDNVAIIDSSKTAAKKILATGNGRCNLTNTKYYKNSYNTDVKKYFETFSYKDALSFFEKLGLEWYQDEEGRVYPISNMAKSVQDIITHNLNKKATVLLDQKVVDITKTDECFVVCTEKETFECNKLVVAAGGNCSDILEKLGVCYKKFTPSLVSLKSNDVKDLNGIKVSNVLVKVVAKDIDYEERGEVLFKDNGLSGIVIFNISALFARAGKFEGKVIIDLLPDISLEDLKQKLMKRKSLKVNTDKLFVGMFANSLANEIFRQAKVNTNINSTSLSDQTIEKLTTTIKALSYDINGYFDNNQVYSGGVVLNDLDENLMYKDIPGLYIIGEACDVDGMCGGYNLQWAWTSANIVGRNL